MDGGKPRANSNIRIFRYFGIRDVSAEPRYRSAFLHRSRQTSSFRLMRALTNTSGRKNNWRQRLLS